MFSSLVYMSIERGKWLDAHCTIIGSVSGFSSIVSTGDVVFTPGKTGYKCDDGKEYWE